MDRGVGHARLRGRVALSASRIAYACSDGVSCVVACLGASLLPAPAAAGLPGAACLGGLCSLASHAAKPAACQWRAGVPRPLWRIGTGVWVLTSVQHLVQMRVAKPALVFWRWPRARSLPPLITATKAPPPQTATTRSSGGLLLRFTDLRNPLFAAFIDPAEL